MLRKYISFLLVLAAFCPAVLTQGLETSQPIHIKAETETAEKLQKDAVDFLRGAMDDVNNLRSLENRITLSAELAGMMWPHDERQARQVFAGVIGDLRDLVIFLDRQMNAIGPGEPETGEYVATFGETSEASRINRKFATVMGVRQAIARNLAERDAEMAYGFFHNTGNIVTNPDLRSRMEKRDAAFEMELLTQALSGNSPRTSQLAVRSLEKGFKREHVDFLRRLHARDADKAAEFASAILIRLRAGKIDVSNYAAIASLLKFGGTALAASRTAGGKRSPYSQLELRDIAELMAQSILSGRMSYGAQYAAEIDKYAPGRGAQIRARATTMRDPNLFTVSGSAAAPPSMRASGNPGERRGRGPGRERGMSRLARADAMEQQLRAENKLAADIASLATVSKERREAVIPEVRKTISQAATREKKIIALGTLASQVAKLGERELAADIMAEAGSLVETSPRNYRDYLLTWLLVSAHASVDPQKAFPVLEDTILRINETIAALVKAGEFMDAEGEIISDGEVQIGAFGGTMMRELTGEMKMAEPTLRSLARADFERTKELASKFERNEARIVAKMLILRAVLRDQITEVK